MNPEFGVSHGVEKSTKIYNPGIEAAKGLFAIDAVNHMKNLPWVVRSTADMALIAVRALRGIGNKIVAAAAPVAEPPASVPASGGGV